MIEFDQVNDEVNALFLAAWNAGSAAIAGYVPEIRWQGVQYRDLPDGSKFWVRLSKQTVFEEQATLSTCVCSRNSLAGRAISRLAGRFEVLGSAVEANRF
ncbi:hypothetical protein PSV3_00120 [Septimatrevirus PSV32]|uniref:Uncharacterized protein n=1 Tax=Pseudomonas phage PSV3 TaxID=3003632 RepID=A0AAE9VW20_9CAUD|nr:hypothetical protein PM409_gp17 [Pseudomonas phage PSV3]WBF76822.1 hypothetical protein PSV3_00120 [Pseudomonas phage PSV3]